MDLTEYATFGRVAFGVVVALGVLPWLVLPRPAVARSALDAFVINLVRWVAIVIVLSHLLAAVGIYGRLSLLLAFLAIAWFAKYRQRVGGFGGLLHRAWPTQAEEDPRPKRARHRRSWRDRTATVVLTLPVLGLLGVAYWLRVRDAFATINLSPPDAYIHMTWALSFQHNDLWPDGVYPQGMSAILSLLHLSTPMTEMLDVARYSGPLVGTFVVFAIYYVVLRLSRNPGAALLAAGLLGLFGANPEWREPWSRQVALLPQEFGLALALLAVALAVLAVTEPPAGRELRLRGLPPLPIGGHAATVGLTTFAAAMCHPLPGLWTGLLVGVAAIGATLLARRFRQLVGAGLMTLVGAVAGFGVVPLAQVLGVPAYLGYGAGEALADVTGASATERQAKLLEYFGELIRLEHNWLSLTAAAVLLLAVPGVAALFVRRRRIEAAQLLGLAAVGAFAVALFDLRPIATTIDPFYVVRLANLLGPTLPLAFGAGVGGLAVLVTRRITYVRVSGLLLVGLAGLGAMATQFPPDAIDRWYTREEVEYEEMTELTLDLKRSQAVQTYTIVGMTSQRQVLGEAGFFITAWVFARDATTVPHDELLPVPTPDTFVFVEMDPFPVNEIEPHGPTEEYYFNRAKRGRVQAELYRWAEERRRSNPDTTIWHDGEHVRVYRVARNPALRIDPDLPEFKDYTWRPGRLYTTGPTSPRQLEPTFDRLPEPDFGDAAATSP